MIIKILGSGWKLSAKILKTRTQNGNHSPSRT